MRILLAGGGSGGSAAPVIAVAEAFREQFPQTRLLYVGTRTGPERALVEAAKIPFAAVVTGRLRRYATWHNLIDPLLIGVGVWQAANLVRKFHPDVAFGAGGFATVPPLVAARIAGAKVMIHQQDAVPGLANRLLAPISSRVSVALPGSEGCFGRRTSGAVGNPVRRVVIEADAARAWGRLGLEEGVPLILATGGGTGALSLNRIVVEAARELVKDAQILHVTGAGKGSGDWRHPRYHSVEFLAEDFADAMAAADVVVTRAGMSSLAELGALGKAAVVTPMPKSHQEANAAIVRVAGAAVVIEESDLTGPILAAEVLRLLGSSDLRQGLGQALKALFPNDAAQRIAADLATLAAI